MNEERLTALSLAIETGTDMHFDKEELEWLIAAARERNELAERLEINEEASGYDGIYCRDATIKEQDKKIVALKSEIELLKENIRQLTEDRTA